MVKPSQTQNGKAFEYACLSTFEQQLKEGQEIVVESTPQLATAKGFFDQMDSEFQNNLLLAANAAFRIVVRLEPQLKYPGKNIPLYLSLQTDAHGIAGDVRDVLCMRSQNNWELGLSCKHNHQAVKHSRLSGTIDFGQDWFGIPSSQTYFSQIRPLFNKLKELRKSSTKENPILWESLPDKYDGYYVPLLKSFMEEINRLYNEHKERIPASLIIYLIGTKDFYKVITDDSHRLTRVEAINISGTLNKPSEKIKSIVPVPRLKLPTRFYHVDFLPGSQNTIEIVCDEGWTVTMRIHSASSEVEPSLKFDVQLKSAPSSVYNQVEPWGVE